MIIYIKIVLKKLMFIYEHLILFCIIQMINNKNQYFFIINDAFVPPKPKLLDMAVLNFIFTVF